MKHIIKHSHRDRPTGSEETIVRQKRGGKMIDAWHIAARK
jgi:hypothetical protein